MADKVTVVTICKMPTSVSGAAIDEQLTFPDEKSFQLADQHQQSSCMRR